MSFNFHEKISHFKEQGLYRFLKTVERDQGPEIFFGGKSYLNFSSNNYLGLSNHPRLKQAAMAAVEKFGTSSGASRLITGSMTCHEELEKEIAQFKQTEAALVFNSGYQANSGVLPSLMGDGDFIFSDELNHASLIDGCRLSKAETKIYRHGEMGHLEELLGRGTASVTKTSVDRCRAPTKLIITDTVFSMDGDLCPLPEIMQLAEKYDAMVFVDEAHGTGVFGKKGRGVVEHFEIPSNHPRLIQMGTFGKALGSFGAYVCGSRELIQFLINRARSFIYSTSLPPGVCEASRAAIQLINEDPSLKKCLWKNIDYFSAGLKKIKINYGTSSIFPIMIGDAQKTMHIAGQLFEQGLWATGIRPPTVPEGMSRIRLTLMATHTREHLDRCLDLICEFVGVRNSSPLMMISK